MDCRPIAVLLHAVAPLYSGISQLTFANAVFNVEVATKVLRHSRGPRRNSGAEISRRYICGTGDNFSGVKSTPTCYEYSLNLPFSPFRTDVRPGAQLHRQIEFSDFWLVVHCTPRPNNKQTTMPSFKLHYIFYHLSGVVFVIGQISIAKIFNVFQCIMVDKKHFGGGARILACGYELNSSASFIEIVCFFVNHILATQHAHILNI